MVRICSLLPSATEILCALGLGDQIVAVSHECDYPLEILGLPKITKSLVDPSSLSSAEINALVTESIESALPLYQLDAELLRILRPELIVTQDLCLVCAVEGGQVRQAASTCSPGAQLISLHIGSVDDLWQAIQTLGEATCVPNSAADLVTKLKVRLDLVRRAVDGANRARVLCLEWLDPPWIAGHWMPRAVEIAGGQALLADADTPSRRVTWGEIAAACPDVVIVMPCGFDVERTLREVHVLNAVPEFAQLPAVQQGHVHVVDGSAYFNRAGPRLVDGIEILAGLLHPDLVSRTVDRRVAIELGSSGVPI